MEMTFRRRTYICICLSWLLFLQAGCGSHGQVKIPQLETPVIRTEFYRMVTREYIGKEEVEITSNGPKLYDCCAKAAVMVTEITVDIGQEVASGDIVAYVDETQAKKDYEHARQQYRLAEKIRQQTLELQELELQAAAEPDGEEGERTYAMLQEEHRYQNTQHDKQQKELQEQMKMLKQVLEEHVIRAEHDGVVVYRKNFLRDPMAEPQEAVVSLADENMEDEVVVYPVFHKEYSDKVICVGNDSLFRENGEDVVYVRKENGQKEKRRVTLGRSDENYTEVTEGLKEGETVYYEVTADLQGTYEKINVSKDDLNWKLEFACTIESGEIYQRLYRTKQDGYLYQKCVEDGAAVRKGDRIAVVETGVGTAQVADAKNQLEQAEGTYQRMQEEYEEQKQNAADENERGQITCRETISRLESEYEILLLREQYQELANHNTEGKVSIYAETDGVVSWMFDSVETEDSGERKRIGEGAKLQQGDALFGITQQGGTLLKLEFQIQEPEKIQYKNYPISTPRIGQKVSIRTDGGMRHMEGRCVGMGEEEKNCFYVKPDIPIEMEEAPSSGLFVYEYLRVPDAVTVPKEAVFIDETTGCSYVWCIENEEMIRRFVHTDDSFVYEGRQLVYEGIEEGQTIALWDTSG